MTSAFCGMLYAMVCLLAGAPGDPPSKGDVDGRKRIYETTRVGSKAPVVDGVPDDEVWQTVDWAGGFIQRDPTDGAAPSYQTQFKVVYDDQAIYFAFKMEDDPAKVSRLMDRRDRFPGDWIEVNIDSYGDRRTAFSFTLSLSGNQGRRVYFQ